jgi:hypothetical protein
MIKGAINQEEITILNIYEPNIGAPNYIKKKKHYWIQKHR